MSLQGSHCSVYCSEDTFGDKCSQKCSCKNYLACSPIDGSCVCKEGKISNDNFTMLKRHSYILTQEVSPRGTSLIFQHESFSRYREKKVTAQLCPSFLVLDSTLLIGLPNTAQLFCIGRVLLLSVQQQRYKLHIIDFFLVCPIASHLSR